MSTDFKNDIKNTTMTSPDHSLSRYLAEITVQKHVLDSYVHQNTFNFDVQTDFSAYAAFQNSPSALRLT